MLALPAVICGLIASHGLLTQTFFCVHMHDFRKERQNDKLDENVNIKKH